MDVSVRTLLIFWGSEDLMALAHSDVFNKYCQRVSLMSHFWARWRCFMVGPHLSCLYSYTVYGPTSKNMLSLITWIVIALFFFFIKTITDNDILFTITGTNRCDPSVCSRSWGPVSCVPPYHQLAALVLLPAFLWRGVAWSHHLCGILHREQPWQPGKPADDCGNGTKGVQLKLFLILTYPLLSFKWRLLCLLY